MEHIEHQESATPTGDVEGDQGAKRKRRRRRGKRQPNDGTTGDPRQEAPTADDNSTAEPVNGDADTAAKRKRRRKKKKSPAEGPVADAVQPEASNAPAQPKPVQPRQPRPQRTRQNAEGGQRDRRGRERKEPPAKPAPVLGAIVRTELLREDAGNEPMLPPVRQVAANVDAYVNQHKGWQREILMRLRDIIRVAEPDITESIKWSQPVFEFNGPVCYIKAFTDHINLGFWRGTEIKEGAALLIGDGVKMRHISVRRGEELDREALTAFVKQAVKLNREKGDPTEG